MSNIVKVNEKGTKIIVGGYSYTLQHTLIKTKRWKCSNKTKNNCPGTLSSSWELTTPAVLQIEHNHAGNSQIEIIENFKNEIKSRSRRTCDKPSQIFAEAVSQIPAEALLFLPKESVVKRTIRNQRTSNNPALNCINDVVIEDDWALVNGQRFLLADNKSTIGERIILFATDDSLKILTEAKTWYCDGNFNLSPKYFLQLYVIRVQKNDSYITAVYCFLECKTMSIYEEMFKLILTKCAEYELFPDPTYLNVDFEKAVISAVQTIFGSNLTIRGCFYHMCQSTYRKIQDLGLTNMYKNSDEFSHFCGMLDGLAFLPLERVFEGMAYLKTIASPEGEDLLNYFDATYVNGPLRKVGVGTKFKFKKISPLFPPNTWNVHKTTINGDHRTNNICESWNNRFTHLVGHSHPTIWTLIHKMRLEVAADRAKLAIDSMGDSVKKKQNLTYTRLVNLCQRIANNSITIEEFLEKVGHNIRTRPR